MASTLETFGIILKLAGHAPMLAATANQGLALAHQLAPDFVLTDLRLPDLSGIDVLRRIRAKFSDVPVVIMTGFPSIESAMEAGKLGAVEYLTKPVCDEELLATVNSRLTNQPARSQSAHVLRALSAIEGRYQE